jgi:transposase
MLVAISVCHVEISREVTTHNCALPKPANKYLRTLLVECANFILGPFGQDTALRRWGLKLAQRGGKNARKRALTAVVARKLAILLHRLWVTQEDYVPFYESAAA